MYVPPLFFFTHTSPTDIYTLSLHDALPISPDSHDIINQAVALTGAFRDSLLLFLGREAVGRRQDQRDRSSFRQQNRVPNVGDRKSTRLNSSHTVISYAVFCLKKKNNISTQA